MSKYFVHFYEIKRYGWNSDKKAMEKLKIPYLQGGLGSDAYYQLDGRNTVRNMELDAYTRMKQMRKVQPAYYGFKIIKCDGIGRNERTVYEMPSGLKYESEG